MTGSVSRSVSPTGPDTSVQPRGREPLRTSPRQSAAFVSTGPPTNSVRGAEARSNHCGSTSSSVTSLGRLSTTPTLPSGRWSSTYTTVRRKFGSPSIGDATNRTPGSTPASGRSAHIAFDPAVPGPLPSHRLGTESAQHRAVSCSGAYDGSDRGGRPAAGAPPQVLA